MFLKKKKLINTISFQFPQHSTYNNKRLLMAIGGVILFTGIALSGVLSDERILFSFAELEQFFIHKVSLLCTAMGNTKQLYMSYQADYEPLAYPLLNEKKFQPIREAILLCKDNASLMEIYKNLEIALSEDLSKFYGENLTTKKEFLRELTVLVSEYKKSVPFDTESVYWPFYDENTECGKIIKAENEFFKLINDITIVNNPKIYNNSYFSELIKDTETYILDRGIGNTPHAAMVEYLRDLNLFINFKNLTQISIMNTYYNGTSIWYNNLIGHYLMDLSHFKYLILEDLLLVIAFGVLIKYTLYSNKYRKYFSVTRASTVAAGWSLVVLIILFVFFTEFYYILFKMEHLILYTNAYLYFYETFIVDYYSSFIKCTLLFLGLINLLISLNYIRWDFFEEWEYPVLILFSIFGLFCLVSSFNFLLFFISLELVAITSYFLTAIKRYNPLCSEAGIKYFIQGAMASFFLSFGIALIYGFFGSLAFVDIKYDILCLYYDYQSSIYSNYINVVLIAGLVCLTLTFLFKVSAAPFHFWTPDVYEGSPLVITSFFAIVIKFGVFTSFLRIFYYLFKHFAMYIQPVLVIGAVLSMLVGSIGGLFQKKIKRLFAYSTITHIGYILMAVSSFTYMGLKASLVYILIYCFTMFGIFAYLNLSRNYFTWDRVLYINDLRYYGIHQNNVYFTAALVILVFSLAGIPPLAGFYAKWYVFEAIMSTDLWVLAFIGIFSSMVSCYYYLHIIKVMLFENVNIGVTIYHIHRMDRVVLSGTLVFSLAFPLFASYFMLFIDDLTYNLLYPFEIGVYENPWTYDYLTWSEFSKIAETFSEVGDSYMNSLLYEMTRLELSVSPDWKFFENAINNIRVFF